ncbi:MAG: hypothetical protein HY551_02025 [Elusimicrobia bacterium]|nr:hypothetical protein [Elusimicrobiota bacterium]
MTLDYRMEVRRKAVHLIGLAFLAVFWSLGRTTALWIIGVWFAAESCIEAARLRSPAFNRRVLDLFPGIHREHETRQVSGIFWTTLGCWLTLYGFGDRPHVAEAALLYQVFGDLAAALVGKAFGRRRIGIGFKTIEGSLGCFAACLLCGFAAGLRGGAPWAGAAAATLLELLPLPFNDNLWLPLGSAFALWCVI